MRKLTLLVFVFVLAACGSTPAGLTVRDPYARLGMAGGNAGAFFVIENPGEADVLLSAASDVAEAVELHMTVMDGDVMQMQMQESVPVPAGEDLEFKPGGLHVMLIGLRQDLNPGDVFSLTLTFERAGEIALQVEVRQP